MDDLSRFCCLNFDCPEYGKRGAGNLTVTSRYPMFGVTLSAGARNQPARGA